MLRNFVIVFLYIFTFILSPISNSYATDIQTKASEVAIFDLSSHIMLFEHNIDKKINLSLMNNLMELYIAFSYMKPGFVRMEDKYIASKEAWQKGGASIFLRAGQPVVVRDLLDGIIALSANDASITLAEGISGSQENFVKEMNQMATKLHLTASHFTNVTGLPHNNQTTSARDAITLAQRLFNDFPEYYYLFSTKNLKFNNIYQQSTNTLLDSNMNIDGMIVGSIEKGNYGAIISIQKHGKRVFILVNGLKSQEELLSEAQMLVNHVYDNFSTKTIFEKGNKIEEIMVNGGKTIGVTVKDNVTISYPKDSYHNIKIFVSHNNEAVSIPVKKGQEVGKLHIQIPGLTEKTIPVYAMECISNTNFFVKMLDMLPFKNKEN
ncbi:D-alanyl-D-alanine carboxypeptidase family protein [Ehrlichia ruminantium]|nr:D-alanyl-D-alanine carboxypeptidase family protein [Ehrlichia ruminantium]